MDLNFLIWLQNLRTPFFDKFFSAITLLGGELPIIALVCVIYWCINKRYGDRMLFSLFSGILVNQFLKITFCIQRPWIRSANVYPLPGATDAATGYSFPSGHTANSVACYGGIACSKRLGALRWALWIVVLLIGFSRLYLGVHTPQDVLVSLVIGILLLFLVDRMTKILDKNPKIDMIYSLIGIVLSIALALYAAFKPYPLNGGIKYSNDAMKLAGAAAGLFAGWLFERRIIRFEIPRELWKKALRMIVGLAIVLLIMKGLKAPINALLGETAGSFTRYALLGIGSTAFWPFIYNKLGF